MENCDIKVSVICLTYNHEKYIRQCLDGFVMQKTDFLYEVIVHDDASTDKTADIIMEYAEKYPDIIKPILQKENQHSKRVGIHKEFTLKAAKGKYIALCEGDDCWVDPCKLQKQADALDSNPTCKLCVATVAFMSESGKILDKTMPETPFETKVISSDEMIKMEMDKHCFQTSSYFMVADEYRAYVNDPPEFRRVVRVGDIPMILYFSTLGDIYYINDVMSQYRINSIGSWTDRSKNPQFSLAHAEGMMKMYEEYNKFTNNRYEELCNKKSAEHRITYLYHREEFKKIMSAENKQALKKKELKFKLRVYCGAIFPRFSRFLLNLYRRVKYHE